MTHAALLKDTIVKWRPVIDAALPAHVGLDRFLTSISTVVRRTPKLQTCDPLTIVAGAVQAAYLGLEPDGEMCALVPRWNKDRGQNEATFQLMYKGALKLARNSGEIGRVVARTVYEADEFNYQYGTSEEGIWHKPAASENRGKSYLWYAIAWDPDQTLADFVVLTKADIEYHRGFSSMKDSPAWTKSFDAMARKTAIWELLKLLPKSAELRAALSSDDRAVMFNSLALEDRSAPALVAGDGLAFGDEDLDARDEDPDAAAAEAYVREHQGVIDTDEREVPDDIDPETGERLPLGGEGA